MSDHINIPRVYWEAIAEARDVLHNVFDDSEAAKVIDRSTGDVAADLDELLFDSRPSVDPAEHDPSFRGGPLGEDQELLFAIGEVDLAELVRICDVVWGGSFLSDAHDTTIEELRARIAKLEIDLVHDWFIMRAGVPGDDEYTFWIERAAETDPHAFRGTWLELG